jgi:hypothetical protein
MAWTVRAASDGCILLLCNTAAAALVLRWKQPLLTADAVLDVGRSQTYTHLIVIHGIVAWLDAYGIGEHTSCSSSTELPHPTAVATGRGAQLAQV